MPHMKKVCNCKGSKCSCKYKVTNKYTGKSKTYKSKAAAEIVVKKGYHQTKPKSATSLDYGTKMFTVDAWKPKNVAKKT